MGGAVLVARRVRQARDVHAGWGLLTTSEDFSEATG